MSLSAFFAAIAPMLSHGRSAAEVTAVLGPSSSGDAALGFYAVLVARNLEKILREVFPSVKALALQRDRECWATLVADYARMHPPRGHDPNGFALAMPGFLAARADVPPLWVELADFHLAQIHVFHAPDPIDGDGFEARIVVRQYTHAIPTIVAALARDGSVPPAPGGPCVVVIHRHAATAGVRVLHPSAAGLAALARRRGLELPPVLAALDAASIDRAEHALVRAGVLVEAAREVT